jgi:hypothetical protein
MHCATTTESTRKFFHTLRVVCLTVPYCVLIEHLCVLNQHAKFFYFSHTQKCTIEAEVETKQQKKIYTVANRRFTSQTS